MSVFGDSETTANKTTYLSTCDIEFVHPGVIYIEQLPFASRQHVIAYRVGGLTLVDSPPGRQNGNGIPLSSLRGGGGTSETVVKYGTRITCNFRSPSLHQAQHWAGGRHP
jgi:hypothetical protein